ncbi:hypothetical protein PHET_02057 [Paragonimus heterotremus]|uniref:Ion transport domain-containing protein n=1 Tax=Paragonimus heterotremus TaxID=100268 RepID=A0A8J4TLV1_9TREM|nr:hypothetical protein PHET_02057 [Paragonimus heterotremus]
MWLEVAQRRQSSASLASHGSTFVQTNSFRDTSLLTLPEPDKRTASSSWLFQPSSPTGWMINRTTNSSSPTISHTPTGQIVETGERNQSGQTEHALIKRHVGEYKCQPFMSGSDCLSEQLKSDLVTDSSISEVNSALLPEHIDSASPSFYLDQDPLSEIYCETTPKLRTNDGGLKYSTGSLKDTKCTVPDTSQNLLLTKLARRFLRKKSKPKNKLSRVQNIQTGTTSGLEPNQFVKEKDHRERTNQVDPLEGNNDKHQLKNLSGKKVPEYKMQQFNNPKSVFLHYGLFRIVWDRILLLFTFYIAFVVPYNVAFGRPSSLVETRRIIFDLLVELLLIVDVILNFNTTYVNKNGQLVHKRRQLAANYVRGWFLLDALAALPVDFMLLLVHSVQNARSHLVNDTSLVTFNQSTTELIVNSSRVIPAETDEGILGWNTVGHVVNRHFVNHENGSKLVYENSFH